jgi:hypothetical protein
MLKQPIICNGEPIPQLNPNPRPTTIICNPSTSRLVCRTGKLFFLINFEDRRILNSWTNLVCFNKIRTGLRACLNKNEPVFAAQQFVCVCGGGGGWVCGCSLFFPKTICSIKNNTLRASPARPSKLRTPNSICRSNSKKIEVQNLIPTPATNSTWASIFLWARLSLR